MSPMIQLASAPPGQGEHVRVLYGGGRRAPGSRRCRRRGGDAGGEVVDVLDIPETSARSGAR